MLGVAADAQLPPALQVLFDSLRAWRGMARDDVAAVLTGLSAMADKAPQAPDTRYPKLVDMSYRHGTGLPGMRPLMLELRQLCHSDRLGEVRVPSLDARLAFWHGEPGPAREREVPALRADGQGNQRIARALGLSLHPLSSATCSTS